MTKLFALAFAAAFAFASAAAAQTPATNPMPDGSHDMYVGLGVVAKPRYAGAAERETAALPVVQFQWSNGAFVSGMSAGIHLSRSPRVEFGPLVEVQPRRSEAGSGDEAGGIDGNRFSMIALPASAPKNRLAGMPEVRARLQAGGFLNVYLNPGWRLTGSALYGAGNARRGARVDIGVQRLALDVGSHHRVTLAGGLTLVNRDHNEAFFGVSESESFASGNPMHAPEGGLRDVHLGARWNWALTPEWMLSSSAQATRLLGDARHSPLAERPTNLTVSTAIAYRF